MALAHSYSSIKDFEGCPRRYNEVRILKNFKSSQTEATLYGTAVHKAMEDFVMLGTPIPEAYKQFERFVTPLAGLPGTILCEQKMGITADFKPTEFFGKDVWFRGIPDYLHINEAGTVARVADYKTGKSSRYADPGQLELLAAMIMVHYPTVQKVKGALLFLVVGDVIKSEYTRDQMPEILSKWAGRASAIENAIVHGVWNPRSSALCRFCPVQSCEYNNA